MTGKSRWADASEDVATRKREKEEKKRLKADKKQREEEEVRGRAEAGEQELIQPDDGADAATGRPAKRRRVEDAHDADPSTKLLRFAAPSWRPCRHYSNNFETLNTIGQGAYGQVVRAKELSSGSIVAVKELSSYNPQDGIPVTSLREIETLKEARGHAHIVQLLEVVVSPSTSPGTVSLVMEFVEHDLMTLQQSMDTPWLLSETKTLMLQVTSALAFLHSRWILHRDLKTSNILLTNAGQIKLADFGSARFAGDPPPRNLTQLVVTLWYRAPELLLGADRYDDRIDVWSLGCVFAELLQKSPLLPGRNELDQVARIFALCGLPSDRTWPHFRRLPNARNLRIPRASQSQPPALRDAFKAFLSAAGCELLESLLALDPARRPAAADVARHPFFTEDPWPKSSALFPSFPSKARGEKKRDWSPAAPRGGGAAPKLEGDLTGLFASGREGPGSGLKKR